MPELIPKNYGEKDCVVIMLGDGNLSILKGYKAEVTKELSILPDKYPRHHASVSITITGLSNKTANYLVANLEPLSKEETMTEDQYIEFMKTKGFHFKKAEVDR